MPLSPDTRRVWFSRRAIGLHVTVVIVVPLFLALFWWQVQRVRQGNTLSWAYVFEWPFFTGYAVWLWWKLVHEQPIGHPPAADRPAISAEPGAGPAATGETPAAVAAPSAPAVSAASASPAPVATATAPPARPAMPPPAVPASAHDEEDEELAAYNRYLAELNATGRPKRW